MIPVAERIWREYRARRLVTSLGDDLEVIARFGDKAVRLRSV
jgi:hypothetical protein